MKLTQEDMAILGDARCEAVYRLDQACRDLIASTSDSHDCDPYKEWGDAVTACENLGIKIEAPA